MVIQLGAEVAGVNVGRHVARVVACVQGTPGEFVEAKRFGARHSTVSFSGAPTATPAKVPATSSAASG